MGLHRLWSLTKLFLKLSTFGVGGSHATIAMMNEEAVIRRKWLSSQQFAEGLALCEIVPGPSSTQMGIYIGYVFAGKLGGLLAGLCFIIPAFLIVVFLSWLYFSFQSLPQLEAILFGVFPVIMAIILAFCWNLRRDILNDYFAWLIAIIIVVINLFFQVSIFLQFLLAGLAGVWFYYFRNNSLDIKYFSFISLFYIGTYKHLVSVDFFAIPSFLGYVSLKDYLFNFTQLLVKTSVFSPTHFLKTINSPIVDKVILTEGLTISSFWGWERIETFFIPLSWFFLKTGSLTFGGALVIIPVLKLNVVDTFHWLTLTEFINGIALSQIAPGPVTLSSAFIGYKIAGVLGAATATTAVFLPSFVFIMIAAPFWLKLRDSRKIRSFMLGVTPAILGAITATALSLLIVTLSQSTPLESIMKGIMAIAALIALLRYKIPIWLLVVVGAIIKPLVTIFLTVLHL
ncbi:MAG: chromate transporter [Crocosphaera sp.]|nr:chromate transporter [Crocosphaera sp.]